MLDSLSSVSSYNKQFKTNPNVSDSIEKMVKDKTIACTDYDAETGKSVYVTDSGDKLVLDKDYNLLQVEKDTDGSNIEAFNNAQKEDVPWYKKVWEGAKGVVTKGVGGILKAFKEHPIMTTGITAGGIAGIAALNAIPVVGQAISGCLLLGLGIYGAVKAVKSGAQNIKEANEAEKHGNFIRAKEEYQEIGGDTFNLGLSAWGVAGGAKMAVNGVKAAQAAKAASQTSQLAEAAKVTDDAISVVDDAANVTDDAVNAADRTLNLTEQATSVTDDAINTVDDAANVTDDAVNTVDDAANVTDDAVRVNRPLSDYSPEELVQINEEADAYAQQLAEEIKTKYPNLEGYKFDSANLADYLEAKKHFGEEMLNFLKEKGYPQEVLDKWGKDGAHLIEHFHWKKYFEDPKRLIKTQERVEALGIDGLEFKHDSMESFTESVERIVEYIKNNALEGKSDPTAIGDARIGVDSQGVKIGWITTKPKANIKKMPGLMLIWSEGKDGLPILETIQCNKFTQFLTKVV